MLDIIITMSWRQVDPILVLFELLLSCSTFPEYSFVMFAFTMMRERRVMIWWCSGNEPQWMVVIPGESSIYCIQYIIYCYIYYTYRMVYFINYNILYIYYTRRINRTDSKLPEILLGRKLQVMDAINFSADCKIC